MDKKKYDLLKGFCSVNNIPFNKIIQLGMEKMIESGMEAGKKVNVKNIGFFTMKHYPSRQCINPKTGEHCMSKEKNKIQFKSKDF